MVAASGPCPEPGVGDGDVDVHFAPGDDRRRCGRSSVARIEIGRHAQRDRARDRAGRGEPRLAVAQQVGFDRVHPRLRGQGDAQRKGAVVARRDVVRERRPQAIPGEQLPHRVIEVVRELHRARPGRRPRGAPVVADEDLDGSSLPGGRRKLGPVGDRDGLCRQIRGIRARRGVAARRIAACVRGRAGDRIVGRSLCYALGSPIEGHRGRDDQRAADDPDE